MLTQLLELIVGSLLFFIGMLIMVNQYFEEQRANLTVSVIVASDPKDNLDKVKETHNQLVKNYTNKTLFGAFIGILGLAILVISIF